MCGVTQVAIITGSGQGVGAAAAKLFAEHGAKVVVTDIDAKKSDQVSTAHPRKTCSRDQHETLLLTQTLLI